MTGVQTCALPIWSLLALVAASAAFGPFQRVGQAEGRDLIPVLISTARLQVVFGALLGLGLWIADAST